MPREVGIRALARAMGASLCFVALAFGSDAAGSAPGDEVFKIAVAAWHTVGRKDLSGRIELRVVGIPGCILVNGKARLPIRGELDRHGAGRSGRIDRHQAGRQTKELKTLQDFLSEPILADSAHHPGLAQGF